MNSDRLVLRPAINGQAVNQLRPLVTPALVPRPGEPRGMSVNGLGPVVGGDGVRRDSGRITSNSISGKNDRKITN